MALIERKDGDAFDIRIGGSVVNPGTTTLIPSLEAKGKLGNFSIHNRGANTITVFPEYSVDDLTFFPIDDGTGTAILTTAKETLNWAAGYRFVRLNATAAVTTNDVDSYAYVGSQ